MKIFLNTSNIHKPTIEITDTHNPRDAEDREDQEIKMEWKKLKGWHISHLRQEWSRIHRVGDPKGTDKTGLITDIIRATYGNKKVDRAFNINQ